MTGAPYLPGFGRCGIPLLSTGHSLLEICPSSPSFSAQELRQGLGVFGLTPLGPLRILNHSFRPGLSYPLPGVGLDRFDDRKLLRPPLPLGHKAILLETRGYGIPVQVWNTS